MIYYDLHVYYCLYIILSLGLHYVCIFFVKFMLLFNMKLFNLSLYILLLYKLLVCTTIYSMVQVIKFNNYDHSNILLTNFFKFNEGVFDYLFLIKCNYIFNF